MNRKQNEKIVGLRQQSAWTRLESMFTRKVKLSDLWCNNVAIKFLIRSVYETLSSPVNLHLWKRTKSPSCQLCRCIGSLKHSLSRCLTALADGRYRWQYDQILKEIMEVVSTATSINIPNYDKNLIRFVRAGVKSKPKEKPALNALSLATDWELRADFETRLKFSYHIAQITPRHIDIFK